MNILLLSAYDADSHKRWRIGLVEQLSEHDFTVLHLPARYFSWRIRGNALTWALDHKETLLAKAWDCIIATSMVDLATLKGLVPELASIPTLLYFHENQFAYPQSLALELSQHKKEQTRQKFTPAEPQMVSLYSALAAKKLVFNSRYNYQTFFDGAATLLKRLPDHVPANIIEQLQQKSSVIPVPLEQHCFDLSLQRSGIYDRDKPLTIIWNHRWEYDKAPEKLLEIIQCFKARYVSGKNNPLAKKMCWHVVGQQFREQPSAFTDIQLLLKEMEWQGAWGYLPRKEYENLLVKSDIVLSTARHDFQGLSIMEAVAAGCLPVLPNALAYPDFFSSKYCYRANDATSACTLIEQLQSQLANNHLGDSNEHTTVLPAWPTWKVRYVALLKEMQ